jgi:hypothetical protein
MMYFVFSIVLVLAYIMLNFFAERPEKKSSWIGIIIGGMVIGGAFHIVNYFIQPTFNYNCWPVYLELLLFTAISIVFTSIRTTDADEMLDFENKAINIVSFGAFCGIVLLLGAAVYTWDNFHTQFQRNLLVVKDTVDVKKDASGAAQVFSPIPVEKMSINPSEVVNRAFLNQLGDLKNTFEISPLTKQSVTIHCDAETIDGKKIRLDYDNQLMYVGILEFKDFWTWKSQKTSPAYLLADAADKDKVWIISKVNGEELKIAYTPEANFSYNLERHLRSNGFASTILDDFNIEIDENGRPYAPVTTLEKVVGMSTPQVTGVAVVDVQTGDIKWYKPEDAPSFVNRIYPEWLVYDRITNWGEYPNGYFHWTNNDGLLQPCEGMDIVQTKNGCSYYVGIQAKTGTFDTEGYMLVDIRTGVATYYRRDGISEAEAVRVLKTNTYKNISIQVNDSILYLTEPIYYNIEGLNTFFATFVANADLTVKYYAFCSADSKDVVGVGETLEEAKAAYVDSYHKHMAVKSAKFQTTDKRAEVVLEAVVLEKVQEGNAYYFRLEGQEGKTFYAYSSITPEVRWSAKKIKITYNKTDAKLIAISSYQALD